MFVHDTSALIYWTLDPDHLTENAKETIKQADQIVISSMSVWEIGLKVKQGKLDIPIPISHYAERLNRLDRLVIQNVTVNAWLENLALEWDHRDPVDRTIVATAQLLSCPLVTSDKETTSFYKNTIW
ncbi:MAG TPA: type II toxin-antitoxin system VapC family toxin [candidate division Zixibacteria bacterium]|nr:type II toxin-antitoxin system VapC family toxin [candidate division Zixibacteria bacterium]